MNVKEWKRRERGEGRGEELFRHVRVSASLHNGCWHSALSSTLWRVNQHANKHSRRSQVVCSLLSCPLAVPFIFWWLFLHPPPTPCFPPPNPPHPLPADCFSTPTFLSCYFFIHCSLPSTSVQMWEACKPDIRQFPRDSGPQIVIVKCDRK